MEERDRKVNASNVLRCKTGRERIQDHIYYEVIHMIHSFDL